MALNVVQFSDSPPLTDVVACIRRFADRIEAGEFGEVDAVFALMPRQNDYPTVFGWGAVAGTNDPVVQFELAKMWLLMNLTARG